MTGESPLESNLLQQIIYFYQDNGFCLTQGSTNTINVISTESSFSYFTRDSILEFLKMFELS
jgi:hypothetical protein